MYLQSVFEGTTSGTHLEAILGTHSICYISDIQHLHVLSEDSTLCGVSSVINANLVTICPLHVTFYNLSGPVLAHTMH